MVEFRIEPVDYLYHNGLLPLSQQQWEEEELDKHVIKNEPDWEEIAALEAKGKLRFFVMRDGEKLSGYAMIMLVPSLLSRSTLTAFIQDLYLDKNYRKGMTAIKFYRWIEKTLEPVRPHIILAGERPHMFEREDGLKVFYERLGYKMQEKLWSKTPVWGNA